MGNFYVPFLICIVFTMSSFSASATNFVPVAKSDDFGENKNDRSSIDFGYFDNDLQTRLQAIMDAQTLTNVMDESIGGVSASIITSCDEIYDVFTGDEKEGVPLSAASLMGLSDVSQTVLSVIALKLNTLQSFGVLPLEFSIDQPISNFIDVSILTNIPGDITVEQLLRHTSGLDDFADHPDYRSTILTDPQRVFTPEEITSLFVDAPEIPGTFKYARTNYMVLSLVLEAVISPFTLQDALSFFLGVAEVPGLTFYSEGLLDFTGTSTLYADLENDGQGIIPLPSLASVMTGTGQAGSIMGIPSDIVQLIAVIQDSLDSESFISEEEAELLNDFSQSSGRLAEEYGLGLELFNLEINEAIIPFVGHFGDVNFKSIVLYNRETEIGIFLSTNNSAANNEELLELARQLLEETISDDGCMPMNEPPNAIFTADPTEGDIPLEVVVDASGSTDPDGMIVSYEWDFGDGTTGTGLMTSHTYNTPGTYTITLTVTDDDGATDTAVQTITVEMGEPGTARVQVIHNADSETVSIMVNGEELVPSFAYRTATPYIDLPAGVPLEIMLVPVNPWSRYPDPINVTVTLVPDETYVMMAYGTFEDTDDFPVEVGLFAGAIENVGDQEVALQFFHGSNDAGDVDIVLEDGSILFDDVAYGGFGDSYLVVPADRYTFSVTPADDNGNAIATYSAGFSFWKRRSAVIFASELLGDGTFEPWVALSNGGTYPLSPLSGIIRPEVISQSITPGNESFKILPNPAYDLTHIFVDLPEISTETTVTLHGMQGQVMKRVDYGTLGKGRHSLGLNTTDLATGNYYLQLRTNTFSKVLPLVIIH